MEEWKKEYYKIGVKIILNRIEENKINTKGNCLKKLKDGKNEYNRKANKGEKNLYNLSGNK